jgi:arylsulfatase A-like enzyme
VTDTDAAGPAAAWDRSDAAMGLALVAAFVATRLLWIALDPLSTQYWEEGYRWLAVEEISGGAALPLLDYQADHYQGGSLVLIGLSVALSWLGVGSLAALKLVAVGFSSATCAALFVIGRAFFGRVVGVLSALIYLLGPPLVAYWGVVAMGFHAESALFTLVGMGLCLRLAQRRRRTLIAWFGLGVVSGLAMWFAPIAAIGVLACIVSWPLLAARPTTGELLACAAGLYLGLAPWLVYEMAHDFAGFTRILEVYGLEHSADPWRSQGILARAWDLVSRAPAQGLLDPGGDAADTGWLRIAVAGVWLPAGFALAASLRRAVATLRAGPRRVAPELSGELVFWVYALLYVAVYLGSRVTLAVEPSPIAYRLMVPPAVLLIPPIAVSAARGMRAPGVRAGIARTACAVALLSLAATTLGFARHYEASGTPLTLERADVAWGHLLVRKFAYDLPGAVAQLNSLPDERRVRVLGGIGWGLQSSYEQIGRIASIASALARLAPADRGSVERGIVYWSGVRREQLVRELARSDDPDTRKALARLDELALWLRHPPVVLITLDTTRVDHLSCYGYERKTTPRLDAFAARAVRFDRAWSTSSWTLPAHASLFTGYYPSRHGADYDSRGTAVLGDVLAMPVARLMRAGKLADRFTTLAELLAARGYRTGAFVAGPWLHRSFGLLQGFERQDDAVSSFGGRPATQITAAARAWLDGIGPEQPYFLFANYFEPHAPYEPIGRYPEFPRAGEPLSIDYDALMRGTVVLDEDTRAVLRDHYDAEIRDMDQALGELIEAVLARPGGERTLIIVTADHGEALGEEGRLGHGFWLSEELTRIPLLVRYPGDRDAGRQREDPIQLVDVLPLLAPELDFALPEGLDGVPPGARHAAFAELRREITTALRFGAAYDRDLQTVVRWPDKLQRSDDGRETLLRLSESTLHEQPQPMTDAAAPLQALLDAHARRAPKAPVHTPATVDVQTLEALRQLGYIE